MVNTKRTVQQKYREQIKNKYSKSIFLTPLLTVLLLIFVMFFPSLFENEKFEDRWERVLPMINKSLLQESMAYSGIALEFRPKPIKVKIYTSFSEENQHEESEKLIQRTNQLILLHELPFIEKDNDYVVKEIYEIIVYDTNENLFARKSF